MAHDLKILLLEDNSEFRETLAEVLEDQGYQVIAAASGTEAVELAQHHSFHLVVTDIRMEGIDGLEALDQIKQQQPAIASLVITGYSTEDYSLRALRLGVDDYLKKPFELSDFTRSVGAVLKEQGQEVVQETQQSALDKLALWALELAVEALPRPLARAPFDSQGAELAERLTLALGLESGTAMTVRQAALVRILECEESRLKPLLRCGAPEPVRQIVEAGHLPKNSSPQPLGARVLAVVEARLARPEASPEELLESSPELDPEVVRALSKLVLRGHPGGSTAPGRRGLLALGAVLEDQRDHSSARKAYQRLVEAGDVNLESLRAQIRLAHLSEAAESQAHVTEALRMAHLLGPTQAARVTLETALLQLSRNPQEGAALLEQACRQLEPLELYAHRSVAELARLAHGLGRGDFEPGLRVLSLVENRRLLVDCLPWLFPPLLEHLAQGKEEGLRQWVTRLAGEYSHTLADILKKSPLGAGARLLAVELLAAAGDKGRVALEVLAADPEQEVHRQATRALSQATAKAVAPLLRLYSLGEFECFVGENEVEPHAWHSQKVRYLLAYLAACNRPVPEELVLETFWPGDPSRGRNNLNSATSRLRRHLREAAGDDTLDYVLRRGQTIALNPELPRWHDVDLLEAALARAARAEPAEALTFHRAVSQAYTGEYLSGCYDDWALERRTALRQSTLEALVRLLGLTEKAELHQQTVEYSLQVLSLDPYSALAHESLMRARLATGRPEEALRHYEECRKLLARELEMEPTIEMLRLRQRALLALG